MITVNRRVNKRAILKAVFAAWLVLWMFFLIREDKDGQYGGLRYLYTHDHGSKVRYIIGDKLYGFLVFCRQSIPEGSTYELAGFERFSVNKVRARYFLWPLKNVEGDADFRIVYGREDTEPEGYKEYKQYGGTGRILVKEERNR